MSLEMRPRDVLQATDSVFRQGIEYGANWFHFVFDQNEPFLGHIKDRRENKKARRDLEPINTRVTSLIEADMRRVPALQVADIFAWCVTNKLRTSRHRWQNRILRLTTNDWLTYDILVSPRPGVADQQGRGNYHDEG